MPVLMSTAITEVRALLDESVAAFWTDAQLQSWINQGCADVARRGQCLWAEQTVTVVALTQQYDFADDFLTAHRAEFSPTGSDQTYACDYREINTMDEIWGILHALPAAWPQYFTIRGGAAPGGSGTSGFNLMLYPSPGAAGTLTVYYYRQAATISVTSSPIDTLNGWEDVVYDYAVYKALRAAKDSTWQQAYQLYESNIGKLIDKSRLMTDLATTVTTGIPQWPVYAYADTQY